MFGYSFSSGLLLWYLNVMGTTAGFCSIFSLIKREFCWIVTEDSQFLLSQ